MADEKSSASCQGKCSLLTELLHCCATPDLRPATVPYGRNSHAHQPLIAMPTCRLAALPLPAQVCLRSGPSGAVGLHWQAVDPECQPCLGIVWHVRAELLHIWHEQAGCILFRRFGYCSLLASCAPCSGSAQPNPPTPLPAGAPAPRARKRACWLRLPARAAAACGPSAPPPPHVAGAGAWHRMLWSWVHS